LGLAANKAYEFVWNEYCDWYIEISKKRLYGEDKIAKETVQKVLVTVLENILKVLHPFIPFITEEIWQHIPGDKSSLIISNWPKYQESAVDKNSTFKMESIMTAIKNLRNVRAEMEVAPSRKARLIVHCEERISSIFEENSEYFKTLASCSDVLIENDKKNIPDDAVSVVIDGGELFLPLDDLIDFEKEMERLQKEKEKLESEVLRVDKKLANEGFVKKAPEKLIEEEKAKKEKYSSMLETVNLRIESMKLKIKK
jgi:valyl-tRNA synthetase